MPCENCRCQFTLFKRKKSCSVCRRLYCVPCLVKSRDKSLCGRCVVFTKRPLSRIELLKLKPKDLIFYLQSKHISTSGCVEKEDLVTLVLAHAASAPRTPNSTTGSTPSDGTTGFESNFRSYINSFANSNETRNAPATSPNIRTSNSSGNGGGGGNASEDSAGNPLMYIKQGCQILFDNFTDKLSNNFKFDNVPSNNSRSHPSSSSGTTPSGTSRRTSAQEQHSPAVPPPPFTPPTSPSHVNNPRTSVPRRDEFRENPENIRFQTGNDTRMDENDGLNGVPAFNSQPDKSRTGSQPRHINEAKRKFKSLLDDALFSGSGCECSDDEESKQKRSVSQSTSNLLANACLDDQAAAGPSSGLNDQRSANLGNTSNENKNGAASSSSSSCSMSPSFSSFEELGAVGGETDSNGHGIKNPPQKPPFHRKSSTIFTDLQSATNASNPSPLDTVGNRRIMRRRSDGCLNATQRVITDDGGISVDFNQTLLRDASDNGRQTCCDKCGKTKNQLKKRLKRFHDQLKEMSSQDDEIRQHLDAILRYLEKKRLSSMDVLSNEDSNEENSVEDIVAAGHSRWLGNSVNSAGSTNSNCAQAGEEKPKIVYKRRFIKLDDIHSSTDLEELSVKQLKEILMLNRVDFKGCCEKNELIERVQRLWQDYNSVPAIEKLPTDDLCKICMDAPIECVILECGHVLTCTDCGKVLSECPICRQYIVRVVRFFRA